MPALTSLVDVLMATIGIFVIVFALQEIVETPSLVPAPYDALAFCRDAETVALYRSAEAGPDAAGAARVAMGIGPFEEQLEHLFPKGGRLMLGVSTACLQAMADGTTPAQRLIAALDRANALAADEASVLHLYEVVPVAGTPPYDEATLVEHWQADQMAEEDDSP
jgi:hypothetical protein